MTLADMEACLDTVPDEEEQMHDQDQAQRLDEAYREHHGDDRLLAEDVDLPIRCDLEQTARAVSGYQPAEAAAGVRGLQRSVAWLSMAFA
jgi:hypothetical protein